MVYNGIKYLLSIAKTPKILVRAGPIALVWHLLSFAFFFTNVSCSIIPRNGQMHTSVQSTWDIVYYNILLNIDPLHLKQ